MIYLIDDNKTNQQEDDYGCSFIKEGIFNDCLKHLTGIATAKRADFLNELPLKATAVFFHATSCDVDRNGEFLATTETVNRLKQTIKEKKIPYISFSWGHTSYLPVYDTDSSNIALMNKRIFYLNLKDFLEDYKDKKVMDFRVLVDGIRYRKDIIIEQGKRLIDRIQTQASIYEQFNCLNLEFKEILTTY